MNAAAYLEQAHLEELVERLVRQGYDIAADPAPFDLVAERRGERIAYEVKARPVSPTALTRVDALRREAHAQGFSDFRLVLVAPPRPVDVEIEGLEQKLHRYLHEQLHVPGLDDQFASPPVVSEIFDISVDAVAVRPGFTDVVGEGQAALCADDAGRERDVADGRAAGEDQAAPAFWVVPLSFDLSLDSNAEISAVRRLDFDLSAIPRPSPDREAA
ncbi:MAG: hypothetical protein HYU66_13945 [Armatimonadetes bacterium]|nr:hypothetical protein [Armatimonadota bacterium]